MVDSNLERILIVEDMPDNLLVLQATLEHEGYEVLTASDSEAALKILQEDRRSVDLILADVMMPGLSGYELCRVLRLDTELAHLPIVLITAKRVGEADALIGMKAGADDYLIRPIDPELLTKKLRLLLDRKQELELWQGKYRRKLDELEIREWDTRMLVHDIRNPLTGAMASLSLLEMESNITEEQRQLIQNALSCLMKQRDMLQDILLTAAAQNDRLVLRKESLDLDKCIQEQIALHQNVAINEQFTIDYHGLPDTRITADRKLLNRVIANLLMNALKYGKQKTRIDIWLGRPENCTWPIVGSGQLAFVIANQSPPIPAADQTKIFQAFAAGPARIQEGKRPTRSTGIGLGLCFCLKVIQLHGGIINVISPLPGREDGVAFYFILP